MGLQLGALPNSPTHPSSGRGGFPTVHEVQEVTEQLGLSEARAGLDLRVTGLSQGSVTTAQVQSPLVNSCYCYTC